jgi:hypothetical protein
MLKNIKITNTYGATENETFKNSDGWMVKLTYQNRQMTIPFYMGSGHNGKEPELNSVLESLFLDASAENEGSFENWASSLGYDTDSRSAEKIYNQCLKISKKLNQLLGEDYETIENELNELNS